VNIIDEDNFDTTKNSKSNKQITENLNRYNNFFENTDEIYLDNNPEGIY